MWVACWWIGASPAWSSDLPEGLPDTFPPLEETLPLQVPDERRWQDIDQRATGLGRAGAWTTVGGVATAGGGLLALGVGGALGSDGLQGLGALAAGGGMVTAAIGPPMLFAGGLRGARSLRERGVFVTTVPGAMAWTSFSLIVLSPATQNGVFVVAPALYLTSIGLGVAQMRINKAQRHAARLQPVATKQRRSTLAVSPGPGSLFVVGTF